MNAAAAARARAAIRRRGHVVSFRRLTSTYPPTATHTANVKAIVSGYAPEELAEGITVGSRSVLVSTLDLAAAGFPLPLRKNDEIRLGVGFEFITSIDAIDADRKEYNGCLDIVATGG